MDNKEKINENINIIKEQIDKFDFSESLNLLQLLIYYY